MDTIAVIQARTGSTRLPGKVMYALAGRPVLEHVVRRSAHASCVDTVVVATSIEDPDDVIAEYSPRFGAKVIRGSESNVLGRYEQAVTKYNPDIILRITADCPLISPSFIDASVEVLQTTDIDYVSAGLERTFPRGVTCETFTSESFERVIEHSSEQRHKEHVTPYYREHPEEFELCNLISSDLFEEEWLQNRNDLRLTLDEPDDYQLFETVYRELTFNGILDIRDAIQYIDQYGLDEINEDVEQKSV